MLFRNVCFHLISALTSYAFCQTYDESGTLVALAATKSSVFVLVDSAVTEGNRIDHDIARKMVDVGRASSCVLEGHLGYTPRNSTPQFGVAQALRAWTASHPEDEASEAMTALLTEMRKGSESEISYLNTQGKKFNRELGDTITTLRCGEFFRGVPLLVVGHTYLDLDFRVGTVIDTVNEVFDVGGFLKTYDFVGGGGLHQTFPISSFFDTPERASSLAALQIAYHSHSPSMWTNHAAMTVLSTIYGAVESQKVRANFPVAATVDGPNCVRLLTATGRFAPPFDAQDWFDKKYVIHIFQPRGRTNP